MGFNGKIKIYIGVLVELEKWNLEGRKRMDELLAGPAPGSSAEDRVLMTMELGEDTTKQLELHAGQETLWEDSLGPKKAGEISDESKAIVGRMDTVKGALSALNTESETEAAKFGDDVKYLADVTNSTKKFDPWITKMEALVKMWEDQAATADKVTNAISDPSASDMKLEDLEAHLNSLKEMFIQKQKMMDGMNPPTQA